MESQNVQVNQLPRLTGLKQVVETALGVDVQVDEADL